MANEESLSLKTFSGTIWGGLERFSAQGVSFVVMIIMARILTPTDYGLVGMILVFINIAQSLVDSGFSQALIRMQDRREVDNSTAFYFNIGVGVGIYIIMWFLAPLVAKFYNEPRLLWMTRVICVGIIFNSLAVVQRALLTVDVDFKTQAKASIIAAFSAGVVGIWLAYSDFGVWSIVAYHLINLGLNCIMLWVFSSWRPKWMFSVSSFRRMFYFGSKIAVSGLLYTLYVNGYNMAIGKIYKAADLGFYTRGQQFVSFFSSNISGILQKVTYPVLCRLQDDNTQLGRVFMKMIRISSMVVFALMMGLVGVAEPMIGMFLGKKWLYSATLIQILCFGYMWFSVYSLNLNILLVKGRSDLYLKLEIVKKIVCIAVLCALIPFGMEALCWGLAINSLAEVVINSFYTGKLIGVSLGRQLIQLVPSLLYALSMGVVVWLVVKAVDASYIIQFFIGTLSGIVYFILIVTLTRSSDFRYILALIRRKLH